MRKLTLALDDLQVESFATQGHRPPSIGTVRGGMNMQDPRDPSNGFCNNGDATSLCDSFACNATAGCPPPGDIPSDFCISYTFACTNCNVSCTNCGPTCGGPSACGPTCYANPCPVIA